MKEIELIGYYGDVPIKVRISQPFGAGEGYQVMVDNYYHGNIMKKETEWVGHLNPKSELTSDDIQILGDIIDNSF